MEELHQQLATHPGVARRDQAIEKRRVDPSFERHVEALGLLGEILGAAELKAVGRRPDPEGCLRGVTEGDGEPSFPIGDGGRVALAPVQGGHHDGGTRDRVAGDVVDLAVDGGGAHGGAGACQRNGEGHDSEDAKDCAGCHPPPPSDSRATNTGSRRDRVLPLAASADPWGGHHSRPPGIAPAGREARIRRTPRRR